MRKSHWSDEKVELYDAWLAHEVKISRKKANGNIGIFLDDRLTFQTISDKIVDVPRASPEWTLFTTYLSLRLDESGLWTKGNKVDKGEQEKIKNIMAAYIAVTFEEMLSTSLKFWLNPNLAVLDRHFGGKQISLDDDEAAGLAMILLRVNRTISPDTRIFTRPRV
jgi:hypothetical protein